MGRDGGRGVKGRFRFILTVYLLPGEHQTNPPTSKRQYPQESKTPTMVVCPIADITRLFPDGIVGAVMAEADRDNCAVSRHPRGLIPVVPWQRSGGRLHRTTDDHN